MNLPMTKSKPSKRHNWKYISSHSIEDVYTMASEPNFKSKRVLNLLQLMDRDGCKCRNCGLEGTHFETTMDQLGGIHLDLYSDDGTTMTIDHIIPKSKGGAKNWLSNMQIMCKVCNEEKGDMYITNEENL